MLQPVPATKLDGVGPVDNRPSSDKLHQVVEMENIKNIKPLLKKFQQ